MFSLFTASIVAAMAGGLVGALRSLVSAKRPPMAQGFLNLIVGMGLAAMVTEHFMPGVGVFAAFGVGVIIGSVGAHAIDVLQALVPQAVQRLMIGWVERLGGKRDGGESQ